MPRRQLCVALLTWVAVLALAAAAEAALSDVVAAFRGKIILSRGPLSDQGTDKEIIARVRAAQLQQLAGTATQDGESWRFHYTVFLRKVGNVGLRIRYISGEKDGRLAAESPIPIPDVDSPVLTGELSISESEGLSRGKVYVLQLVNDQGEVVAKASALFK